MTSPAELSVISGANEAPSLAAKDNSPPLRHGRWLSLAALFVVLWLSPPISVLQGVDIMPLWLHSFTEMFAIVVAMLIFGVGWNNYGKECPGNIVILACTFLAVGLIDFAHFLSFKGMPDFVTPAGVEKAINFWLSARLLAAIALLVVAFRAWRPFSNPLTRYVLLGGALGIAALIYWLGLFQPQVWPRTFIAGQGLTPFKIVAEYAIIATLLVPAVAFFRQARHGTSHEAPSLFSATVVTILSELCFTLYSDVSDGLNMLGHIYKVLAYFFLYQAIFVSSVRAPFRRAQAEIVERKRVETALRESYDEIADLYNNAPCGYHSLDENGVIVRINDTELDWLGYPSDEILGKKWFGDLLTPPSRQIFLDNYPGFKARGYVHDLEYEMLRKDGSVLTVLLSATVLRDAAGNFLMTRSTVFDISKLKQAEADLMAREELLDTFMAASPAGMVILDRELRHVRANPAIATINGLPVAAHLGRTVREVLPKLAPVVEPLFRQVLESGEALRDIDVSAEVPHDPGKQRSWMASYFPIFGGDGKPVALGGVVLDITERKRIENRLKSSEAALAQAQQIGRMGSWEWELPDGKLTWSQEMFRIYGLDPKRIDPSFEALRQIVPQQEHAVIQQAIDGALKEALPYDIEYHIARPDRSLRLIHGKAQVFRDKNGIPARMIGVVQDITEQRKNLLKLEHLNRLYSVLSKSNEMFVRVRSREELFSEACRIPIEEGGFRMAWIGLIGPDGKGVAPVVHWGHEAGYLEEIRILAVSDDERGRGPTGTAVREGVSVICSDIESDERMRPWRALALQRGYRSSAAFPIRENGVVIGTYSVYSEEPGFFVEDVAKLVEDLSADISFAVDALAHTRYKEEAEARLKLLNEALEHRVAQRTRQLEAANKELEAFSYSVSHDLRAPLRSVDGFSQILLKNHASQLDDTGRDYLNRVSRASKRMGELIDDLLMLSRVSRSEIKKETIDLSKLVCSVGREIKAAAPERQVEWLIQEGVTVQADGRLMRAMLENLLSNAWKFTAKTEQARIEFGALQQNGEKLLFVRDNGAGFDMQYAYKLFGAFQRLHRAEEFEGTGIGLATVQRIVNHHGGRIWAEGAVGQGATFYFTI